MESAGASAGLVAEGAVVGASVVSAMAVGEGSASVAVWVVSAALVVASVAGSVGVVAE